MRLLPVRGRTVLSDSTVYVQEDDLLYAQGNLPQMGEAVLLVPVSEREEKPEETSDHDTEDDLRKLEDRLYPFGTYGVATECMFQEYMAFATDGRYLWSDLQEEDGLLYVQTSALEDRDRVDPFQAGMQPLRFSTRIIANQKWR